ncbi:GNAT family N-acetyltransferase [Ferrimonas senticii]|uniref:GNAT family N-acetyltransferase n=1 Tax=Ferrimonas senticii TaxID=394566 RepID=UPI0004084D91|nr:GNAT family N-acetyltransferase [Ferrimonas senticii]
MLTELTIRPLNAADLPLLLELEGDEQAMFYTGSPGAKSAAEIAERLDKVLSGAESHRQFHKLVAQHPEHGAIGIVLCYLGDSGHGEIGYMLLRRLWGQGLGQQLAVEALALGQRQFPKQPLVALVYEDNVASWKCLLNIGFTITKRLVCPDRGLNDMVLEWTPSDPD